MQVEESVVAGKLLLASMRRLRPAWHYELKDLLDMEMVGVGWAGVGWGGPVTHSTTQWAPAKGNLLRCAPA